MLDRPFKLHKGGLAPWQLRKIRDHVINNLDRPISVSDLATLVNLSTSHFSRAFLLSTGSPPHAFVMEQRLEQATQMMQSGPAPLAAIAAACGLCDQAHLTRLFVRHMGEPPGSWRRRSRSVSTSVSAPQSSISVQA